MEKIPKRLKNEPLIEAIWELRFSGGEVKTAEILPGMIYGMLKESYGNIVRLPSADLPEIVLNNDPHLKYAPTVRMEGDTYTIQAGSRAVSLSCRRPYTGWDAFKKEILKLAEILKATELITSPERFSLKYIDVISSVNQSNLSLFNTRLELAGQDLTNQPVHIRTEFQENEFLHIVQIASPSVATLSTGEKFEGALLDIDTIYSHQAEGFWNKFDQILEEGHKYSKRLFFSLLTKETIIQLGPEY